MNKYTKITISCLAPIAMLAGCATSQPVLKGQLDPTLGSAVKANAAMQAVAPSAAQKANTFIPADSTRTRQARQNYRENKIQEPVHPTASSN